MSTISGALRTLIYLVNVNNNNGESPDSAPSAGEVDFIRWDQTRMTTGVASIDEQHQELISELNKLHRAHMAGASTDDINKILRFLGRFAETHFQYEENLMEERQCPVRKENCIAHAKFLHAYQELVSNYSIESDPDQTAAEIKSMAARWLAAHICRIDISLRDCPAPAETADKKP